MMPLRAVPERNQRGGQEHQQPDDGVQQRRAAGGRPGRFRRGQGQSGQGLVLRGGHWCPGELPGPADGDFANPFQPWNYAAEAKVNPFFAQVWCPLHGADENDVYGEEIYAGMKGYE
ncbi:MAG: hypothetical protein FWF60_02715 [Oscillospiraceae bacterium]|nr:hypothetical protein [Oscillospiraceae bacterium]